VANNDRKVALIVGASRGLGLAMAEEYLKHGWKVIATERTPSKLHDLKKRFPNELEIETIDVAHREQISNLKKRLEGQRLDLLFVNAGIGDGAFDKIGDISDELFERVMMINTLAPMRIIDGLGSLVSGSGTIGVMSSELGSVSANTQGGWEVYRASKAALNMLIRSYGLRDPADRRTFLSMTPGWVKTDLGGAEAALEISESIPSLVRVILGQAGKSGIQYLNYQGKTMPW
jgi:NAD(P)-dependent dehydrogenase (short-subunit alcohol dehydrogenase family)